MNDDHCSTCRSTINKVKRAEKRIVEGKLPYGSGRSIYCCTCKKVKEPGRENESRCKKCKSDAYRAKNAKKREESGLPAWGSGRNINCYDCGASKENSDKGYCNACNRKRDNEWRLKTGRTKKHQTGLCHCGAERAAYNRAYCVKCASKKTKEWLSKNLELKKIWQDRSVARRKEIYVSISRGRIRRRGSLINGNPVLCSECDKLSEGWCENCDLIYWLRKEQYHSDPLYAYKIRARALTRSYIKSGKLFKQPCEICNDTKVQAHHEDYSKPLDVIWLCSKHHAEHHKNEKK